MSDTETELKVPTAPSSYLPPEYPNFNSFLPPHPQKLQDVLSPALTLHSHYPSAHKIMMSFEP